MSVALDRTAASLFSTALLRPIVRGEDNPLLAARLNDYRTQVGGASSPNSEILRSAYSRLRRHYRNEYVYKNSIAQRLFIGRHRAANSALLQEVPIGESIADCLFVNGGVTAYEIKTELDTSTRLLAQIEDYYRVSTQVFVVTHRGLEATYREILSDSPVGIIVMNPAWGISVRKAAAESKESLEHQALFNLLRVEERRVVLELAGIPALEVPNGRRYKTWLDLAMQIDVCKFQSLVSSQLKQRQNALPDLVVKDPRTAPLRSALLKIGVYKSNEVLNVDRWLSEER